MVNANDNASNQQMFIIYGETPENVKGTISPWITFLIFFLILYLSNFIENKPANIINKLQMTFFLHLVDAEVQNGSALIIDKKN